MVVAGSRRSGAVRRDSRLDLHRTRQGGYHTTHGITRMPPDVSKM